MPLSVPVETVAADVADVALMSCVRLSPEVFDVAFEVAGTLIQCQRVTGISGRQPWNPPTGSACCMESLARSPPCFCQCATRMLSVSMVTA